MHANTIAWANKTHILDGTSIILNHSCMIFNASSSDISSAKQIIEVSYSSKASQKFKGENSYQPGWDKCKTLVSCFQRINRLSTSCNS